MTSNSQAPRGNAPSSTGESREGLAPTNPPGSAEEVSGPKDLSKGRVSPVFNIPNQLTAARLLIAVVIFVLIPLQAWWWCLGLFLLAAFTDWLDGYVARIQGTSTALGRMLDPLVDKVLLCGIYIALLPQGQENGWLQSWMVIVVVSRELLIAGMRSYLESQGAAFGADWLGKLKMVLQCAAVFAIFVAALGPQQTYLPEPILLYARSGLIWAMVIATILSGLQYLVKVAAFMLKQPQE